MGYDTNVNFSIVFLLKEIPAFPGMTIFKILFFQKGLRSWLWEEDAETYLKWDMIRM